MAAYVTSKWGLEGYVRSLQMELEGTGVRATIVRPGPTLTGMGMDWDPEVTGEVIGEWVRWGLARHSNFMRPAGVADAIVAAVSAPGHPCHRDRAAARGTHRVPDRRGSAMTIDVDMREPPGCRGRRRTTATSRSCGSIPSP